MHKLLSIVLTLLLTGTLFAQKSIKKLSAPPPVAYEYAAIDKASLLIPDSVTTTSQQLSTYLSGHFPNDADKVRAAFMWIATNIRYDYQNMYFFTPYEPTEEKIKKALTNRKGICENYALLFRQVLSNCGIPAYVVSGFTRQNGAVDRDSHAWCLVKLDGEWAMYDPTWASAAIQHNQPSEFRRVPYYQIAPAAFVRSHMPFDYLWQFLHYPVGRAAFVEGRAQPDSSRPYFHFADSLHTYEQADTIEQMTAAISRIETNGPMDGATYDYLYYLKQYVSTSLYNTAVLYGNQAVNLLNTFVDYRNHRFKPARPDAEIQALIDSAGDRIQLTRLSIGRIKPTNDTKEHTVAEFVKWINGIEKRIDEEKTWLKRYFAPGKMFRSFRFN